jgi:hypothetical protein
MSVFAGDDGGQASDQGAPPDAASQAARGDGGQLDGAMEAAPAVWYADAGGTLYDRLGQHAGIRALINTILEAELGDPLIASYFVNQVQGSSPPVGHPTLDQLAECMTSQLAHAIAGPEKYPSLVSDDAGLNAYFCRDVLTAHIRLDITGGTFDRFALIAAAALQARGVRSADIGALGSAFADSRENVVAPGQNDAGPAESDGGGMF